ncbi:hypothetical protein N1F78_00880 [Seonamhaeicola sp. MEBiC1930]|uniref:hypothetical protein n=1 Tax=Seonamhaeicola sp. MEBiC01930 TaxID=2976768 RepID=UPI0032500602
MTDNDDDKDHFDEAIDAVDGYEEGVSIDEHLKRAHRNANTTVSEIKKALAKQAMLSKRRH